MRHFEGMVLQNPENNHSENDRIKLILKIGALRSRTDWSGRPVLTNGKHPRSGGKVISYPDLSRFGNCALPWEIWVRHQWESGNDTGLLVAWHCFTTLPHAAEGGQGGGGGEG